MQAPKGAVIGIVGRSGSGKSTLLKMLMRFWDVQQGRVTISGTEVARINTDNLRRMESFVTQETHLFRDSIRKNLLIAKPDATDEELTAACRRATIRRWENWAIRSPAGNASGSAWRARSCTMRTCSWGALGSFIEKHLSSGKIVL